MSLSQRILLGSILGVIVGLFFGERAAILDWPARAFVQLLGATVLPYIVTSIISGIARGTPEQGRRLLRRGGLALLVLWVLCFAFVFVTPLLLPPDKGGSSYGALGAAPEAPIDWIELYIPGNPFRSLANNIVPAVVVFSGLLGVALLGLPGKERILAPLDLLSDLLGRAGNLVVALTPIGVFAIAGHAAGTLRLEEFARLEAYLVLIVGLNTIFTLWIVPGLLEAITGTPYRRTLSLIRDPLITAFFTGNLFVVLPQLQEAAKALLAERGLAGDDSSETVSVLVPTAFTFPHSGKILSLSFLMFAAWFAGIPLSAGEYPKMASAGLLSLFGNLNTAIPFLLDLVHLPADLFNLFAVASVLNSRFGSAAAAMHTFALAVLGAHLMARRPLGGTMPLVRFAVTSMAIVGVFVVGSRILLGAVLAGPESAAATFDRLRVSGAWGRLAPIDPLPATPQEDAKPVVGHRLDEIRRRGVLRVCVSPDGMPWSFRNGRGEIVGFDIGLAHILAVELQTRLALVPVPRTERGKALESGMCDTATNRVVPSESAMSFTRPVAHEAWAFMTRDYRRGDFATLERLRRLNRPRIAVLREQEWIGRLQAILPNADVVPISSITEFLDAPEGQFDATFTGFDRASAYSMVQPEFGAVIPSPGLGSVPIAVAVPRGEHTLLESLNAIVEDGLASGLFADRIDYWIKGGGARVEREPRWSVGGSVLGLWK
jgi:Na+/H+-dicarboxylate symporter/ABC-type amino acid transport substrate-binding protein